jgi:hypothetical protein
MTTQTLAALGAVLLGLMTLGITLTYRAYRKGSKQPQTPPEPSTITAKIDTGIPLPPKVVRAPEGDLEWLNFTKGKEYTVVGLWSKKWSTRGGYAINLIDDKGFTIGVFEKKCPYLRGGDWIVVEREGNEKHESSIEQQLFEAQAEATRLAGELEVLNNEHLKLGIDYNMVEKERDNAQTEQRKTQSKLDLAENKRDTYKKVLNMWCSASTKHFYTNSVHIFDKAAEDAFILRNTLYRERDEASAFATDLREQLDRALVVIKDLEAINAELLAMVQGEYEQAATTEPAIDWTKPVAFPKGYVATAGKSVYVLSQYMAKGEVITWYGHLCSVRLQDGEIIRCSSHQLAPENPADHPWHPEFKDSKGNTLS